MSTVAPTSDAIAPIHQTQPLVIILLGPPGSGKGTHAAPLSSQLNLPHISTGDLFREHIRNATPLGIQAKTYIDKGNLVPDALVLDMLIARVTKADCKNGYILDGFPRTTPQALALDVRLKAKITVLNFQLDDERVVQRLTGRLSCKCCSKTYHKLFARPKLEMVCDNCSAPLYQRDDDHEEIIRKRLEVYRAQTEPLIAYYKQKPGVLKDIDSAQNKSDVFSAVLKELPATASAVLRS